MNEQTSQMTVKDRSTEFVPVQGGGESSSAGALLTTAYILMWLLVFAFVWMTSRRLKAIGSRVEELESAVRKADAATRGVS